MSTEGKPVKLDIGAGTAPHGDGFITVDAHVDADIRAPMWRLGLTDESVDEIWASHCLEHVSLRKVIPTLKEWYRVLKKGGAMTVMVPNLDYVCRHWLEQTSNGVDIGAKHGSNPNEVWALQLIFGLQSHPGEYHTTGFSPMLLRRALEQVGFHGVLELEWSHNQECIVARVVK